MDTLVVAEGDVALCLTFILGISEQNVRLRNIFFGGGYQYQECRQTAGKQYTFIYI